MIVTEYMENGALDRYLRVSRRAFKHDSWANRVHILANGVR